MFILPPNEEKITKELLLKHNSEERYMEHYLGIPVKKGLFKSPLRSDKKPTASFYRNKKGDLIFHDFQGDFHGNFISVVIKLFNCSYYKALKIIANDFNIVKSSNYEIHPPKIEYSGNSFVETQSTSKIQITKKDFTEDELKWWESFGISKKTLCKFKVFSCLHVFLNDKYYTSSSDKVPIYGYFGGMKDEIELWRIYMPTKKIYRFLSNWSSKLIQGSKQLPSSGDYLVVTKSLKDVMTLYELNIPAIAPCSENSFLSQTQFDRLKLKFKKIYLFYDNDLPGIRAMQKIRKEFPEVHPIWIPRKIGAKDISDLVKKKGVYKTILLVENFINYGKEKS